MHCAVCGQQNKENAQTCSTCGTPIVPTAPNFTTNLPKATRLKQGNYALAEVLGQGGFGITYKGGDLQLRRYVAIKEFFPPGCARQGPTVIPNSLNAADYAAIKTKFIEEARTLAQFSDSGIVKVFGVFEENNTAYMVMEFLEGQTLTHLLKEKGSLPEKQVVTYAQALGEALATVHDANLIHRDIKPDNILITPDNRVVLIDFGTARQFEAGKTVRQTAQLTVNYAPLEQYSNQARFGPYTDIYSLGATLYHSLTGVLPPSSTDRAAGIELKAADQINPNVSRTVSDALLWAMQIKDSERPQTVGEFLTALQAPRPADAPAPLIPTPIPTQPESQQFAADTGKRLPIVWGVTIVGGWLGVWLGWASYDINHLCIVLLPICGLTVGHSIGESIADKIYPPYRTPQAPANKESNSASTCAAYGGFLGVCVGFALDPAGVSTGYPGIIVCWALGQSLGYFIARFIADKM